MGVKFSLDTDLQKKPRKPGKETKPNIAQSWLEESTSYKTSEDKRCTPS